jgi:diguanylate cyclase (GGDEF)-like protein
MGILATGLAAASVVANHNDPDTPNLISQIVLLVITLWGVGISIFELKQDRAAALDEAERTAFSDPLTSLPNTRMLRRRADALLDARNVRINRPTGMIVLDLDGFRSANMLQGHRDGDRLLLAAARAMYEAAEANHLVARTGSDEFTVLVNDTTQESLAESGRRYREVVIAAIDRSAVRGVSIDASVGVAISGRDGNTFDDLVRSADRSMYLEKASHERDIQIRPRVAADAEVDGMPELLPFSSIPAREPPKSKLDELRWANRPTQVKFATVTWLFSVAAVLVSQLMPDATTTNWAVLSVLLVFGLAMAGIRYVTRPSVRLFQQLLDVVLATVALCAVILVTGKSASPAWPLALMILIYVGWFLPLNWIFPGTVLVILLVLSPLAFESTDSVSLYDAVTIFGGVGISIALMVILYYNHYYLLRAHSLTAALANLDPRAGTNNRRGFEERMRVELEQLSYGDIDALAVVMIDLGNFKSVSANYGRGIGNRMLTEVATALEETSREGDLVARLGGDEFAVVAPGVDAESARALAGRLVTAVSEALAASDLPSNQEVRPSAGFALYGMHGRTTDELVTAADIALTAAKTAARGSDRVSSFVVAL